ncbi:MAG: tetratricopeptide repeat protein [Candidatus Thiodubiliella endoseptemdiera]|uniref:Tetratricopeptide repeat protein n=1 Tax=Candidatus Thiodubiliella endoseptemdiera TaxID=2738886 RepID=A0A853F1F4_9GAMM|nr:tetratricopeptide repeat protein [Candidatus Thiodubiliella endoseptemdiera]
MNAYQKAIEIKPDNHRAYYNMGNTYSELKKYQKAINAYQKAIELPSLIDHAKKQNFDLLESYINNLDDSPVKQQNLFILNQLKGHD